MTIELRYPLDAFLTVENLDKAGYKEAKEDSKKWGGRVRVTKNKILIDFTPECIATTDEKTLVKRYDLLTKEEEERMYK